MSPCRRLEQGRARYIFRHNLVSSGVVAHAVDAHGAEYGSDVGGEWMEVDDNVIEQSNHQPPYYDGWAIRVRGGKGAVWNNTIRGYRTAVELTELTDQPCGPVYVWGNRLEPAGGAMVHARRTKSGDAPESSTEPPPGYRPHGLPARAGNGPMCGAKPLTYVGGAPDLPGGRRVQYCSCTAGIVGRPRSKYAEARRSASLAAGRSLAILDTSEHPLPVLSNGVPSFRVRLSRTLARLAMEMLWITPSAK